MTKYWLGKHRSEATKEKIRTGHLGTHPSEATRRKWSKTRRGKNNSMYGVHRYREENPNWQGGKLVQCNQCGKEIWKIPYELKHFKFHFCSRKCRGKFFKEKGILAGANNSNWKDGISFLPYSSDWTKTLKDSIKQRDNYTCQLCGGTTRLAVHHIDYDKQNCDPKNLITLCNKCNSRANFKRAFWTIYFMTLRMGGAKTP